MFTRRWRSVAVLAAVVGLLLTSVPALAVGGKIVRSSAVLDDVESNRSGVTAEIEFRDDGEFLRIEGRARGLDPGVSYVSLIYDNESVAEGPDACEPAIFDPEAPGSIIDRMFVGFWNVNEDGEGRLSMTNIRHDDGRSVHVGLEEFHTISIRDSTVVGEFGPGSGPAAVVACGVEMASAESLMYGAQANRSGGAPLEGATVSGKIYVWMSPLRPDDVDTISHVEFFVNGTFRHRENFAPYDMISGGADAATESWNTGEVSNGTNTVTAVVTSRDGSTREMSATFQVVNPEEGVRAGGVVGDGSAFIVRTGSGVSVQVHSTGLNPGDAYTAWLFTFDDGDFTGMPDIAVNVAGQVVGASGNATFSGSVSKGIHEINGLTSLDPMGNIGDSNFELPMDAVVDVHIVNHGPAADYPQVVSSPPSPAICGLTNLDEAISTICGLLPPAHQVWRFDPTP